MDVRDTGESSFLDNLTWLPCTFCAKGFTRQKQFYYLSCTKVACIDCAKQMRSSTNPRKINCRICKRTEIQLCPISENMPQNIRKLFANTDQMLAEVMRIDEFQASLRVKAIEHQRFEIDRITDELKEDAFLINEYEKTIEQDTTEFNRYQEEVLKVIPQNRLDQLLELDENELERMDFNQMLGMNRRRSRSSRTSSTHRRSRDSRSNDSNAFEHHSHSASSDHTVSSGGLNNMVQRNLNILPYNLPDKPLDRRQSREESRRLLSEECPRPYDLLKESAQNAYVPAKISSHQRKSKHSRHSRQLRRSRHLRSSRRSSQSRQAFRDDDVRRQ